MNELPNERGRFTVASGVMTGAFSRRRALGVGAGALVATVVGLGAGIASANDFGLYNVMIANPWRSRKAYAQLNVGIAGEAGEGAPTYVTVFAPDGSRQDVTILTNAQGFASTVDLGNLFEVSQGQSALVLARPPSGIDSTATLRQTLDGAAITLGVPASRLGDAPLAADVRHAVVVGDLAKRTSLLVGNVTDGQPADVMVFVGSDTSSPHFENHELGVRKVWEVSLTAAEAHSFLIVESSVAVIVQLAVDDGHRVQLTGPIL
jgi:hypothetical protein